MIPSFLIPIVLVVAVALLIPRKWTAGPKASHAALFLVICGVGLVAWRYLCWRITETMPLPDTSVAELTFYWTLFVIEMLIWFDTAILFLMLSRPRDNSDTADRGEARLRAEAPEDLPTVDVFIATYNEDLDVLEKTIIGAKSLDWPQNRLQVYVLDDGKRDWLKDYCARQGVSYLTRADNAHAKAGNINAAIARTNGEYFLVLDADFVPQRNFLFRAMGLFEDPKVGIVQIPHSFYNADPMQANLRLRKVLPDDQRLFFGHIMAGRDGWNTAFCCGSNSLTRRSAMEAIGNRLPTGSITEDMLLTMALLRKGYVTRYLNERLALGLAPESLSAMYVQRARWARGAMQILFLKEGPFGPGLRLHERIMFIPLHWLAQSLVVVTTLLTPAICLWTNWAPLPGADTADILEFQFPALIAVVAALRLIAPGGFFVTSTMVHNCLQAPRIIPTILTTLFRPHGHAFKVTPKGSAAGGSKADGIMIALPILIILVTAAGIGINGDINTRILDSSAQLPLLAGWGIFSMVVLTIVQAVAVSPRGVVRDESFPVDCSCKVTTENRVTHKACVERLSLSTVRLRLHPESKSFPESGWIRLEIPEIGPIAGFISEQRPDVVDISFRASSEEQREVLIRYLFTCGRDNTVQDANAIRILLAILRRAAGWKRLIIDPGAMPDTPPAWLRNLDSAA